MIFIATCNLGPKSMFFLLGWHCNKHHFCVNSWRRINFFYGGGAQIRRGGKCAPGPRFVRQISTHFFSSSFHFKFFKSFLFESMKNVENMQESVAAIWSDLWAIWANICLGKWCIVSGKYQKHMSGQTLFLHSLFTLCT